MACSIRVECTPNCGATAMLLYMLAELDLEPKLHVRDGGRFLAEDGRAGPALVLDGRRVVGPDVAMTCLVQRFAPASFQALDAQRDRWQPLGHALRDLAMKRDEAARAALQARLDELEDTDPPGWLGGDEPGPVDGLAMVLQVVSLIGIELEPRWPRLAARRSRTVARPAFARVAEWRARIAAADVVDPDTVLQWWLGAPAKDAAEIKAKLERVFLHGALLDDEIRERFGRTIDAARAGALDHWGEDPAGCLALIIVLDQLPRHAFREDARAFASDETARKWCRTALARGWDEAFPAEAQPFFNLPLSHAEDVATQDEAVARSERLLQQAAPTDRWLFQIGVDRSRAHRATIRRHGRFPTRDAILGRRAS